MIKNKKVLTNVRHTIKCENTCLYCYIIIKGKRESNTGVEGLKYL